MEMVITTSTSQMEPISLPLNCKTGYFVGNGSGHVDDLDY